MSIVTGGVPGVIGAGIIIGCCTGGGDGQFHPS
jgi:hypothetical protein